MTNIDGYRWVWSNVAEVDQLIVKGAVYLGNTVTGEYTVLDLVYEWSTHYLPGDYWDNVWMFVLNTVSFLENFARDV